MKSTDEQMLVGYQITKILGGLALLQSSVSIEELFDALPQEHLMWDHFAANYERSVNKERLSKLANYFQKSIVKDDPFDIPHVSLAIYGCSREELHGNGFITLQYEKNRAAVVDGFLVISALSNLLDRTDPFTGKVLGKSVLSEMQKAVLASLDVRINIYYGRSKKISEESLSKLFFDINSIDTKVYSQHIATHIQESPLNLGARKLAKELELDALGGVSELNKITKSDSYVVTHSTLTSIILTSIAGKGARIDKQLPTHLSDKTLITVQVIDEALKTVIPLMKGWVSCLENKFQQNSNGFHRSMQIWQAIGVVAYNLTQNTKITESELFTAGQVLGQMDYSKSASHWSRCKAFKKDASGTYWINATGGGRTMRDKVTDYFMVILGDKSSS
ncbi:DNA sulfur modification protein DndB [Photobacterium leiognathi]|uniref:DNA sulfur modification protein DndB n=1 Tax=Photobacterium leiognathi TaxID=553611 RepID=UPI00298179FC|nr:DNA sulfur modification protein DndB [Photobacterium leiognathi]